MDKHSLVAEDVRSSNQSQTFIAVEPEYAGNLRV